MMTKQTPRNSRLNLCRLLCHFALLLKNLTNILHLLIEFFHEQEFDSCLGKAAMLGGFAPQLCYSFLVGD